MRHIIALLLFLLTQNLLFAQLPEGFSKRTTIYLVRHAEKQSGNDPLLTENGNKRAGTLLHTLKGKPIRHIYASHFKRTQMTGIDCGYNWVLIPFNTKPMLPAKTCSIK